MHSTRVTNGEKVTTIRMVHVECSKGRDFEMLLCLVTVWSLTSFNHFNNNHKEIQKKNKIV